MSRFVPRSALRGMRLVGCIFLLAACDGIDGDVLSDDECHDTSCVMFDAHQPGPWTTVPSPTTTDLYSVWAETASNVVAVGGTPGNTANPGVIVLFDGTSWSPTPYLVNLLGVFARTAVGEYGGEGSMTQWNGTMWSSRQVLAAGFLRGIWQAVPSTYAVGDNGHLMFSSENGIPGSWIMLTSGTNETLHAVWGATATDIYAVGNGGTVLHNANATIGGGGTWTKTVQSSSTLRAIWGSSPTDMYIVGEAPAVILHSTDGGASWTEATLPASAVGLYGITGTSANDIYVVGATGGVVFHSTGNNVWTTQTVPTTVDLFGISAAPSGDLYAVGRNGTIAHRAP